MKRNKTNKNARTTGKEEKAMDDQAKEELSGEQEIPVNASAEGAESNTGVEANASADPMQKLEQEVEAARKRAAEATDQYIRLMAEFDNFRKRSRRELETFREYAAESVLTALLPVLDDFDRTLAAMEKTDNLSSIKDGINLVTEKLHKVLEKEGLNLVDSHGKEFDSEQHEAIHSIEAPEEKKGKVLEVVEKGYRLKDKVIRYAKVIVGE